MQTDKIRATLRELSDLVEQIKAQLQWQKLRQMENSQQSVSQLYFRDNSAELILNLKAKFLATSASLKEFIENDTDILTEKQKNHFTSELDRLQLQQQHITDGITFY